MKRETRDEHARSTKEVVAAQKARKSSKQPKRVDAFADADTRSPVVSIEWLLANRHRFTLKDGAELFAPKFEGVGYCNKRKTCPILIIAEQRYLNEIPNAVEREWTRKNSEHRAKVAKAEAKSREHAKKVEETDRPAPIWKSDIEVRPVGQVAQKSLFKEKVVMQVKQTELVKMLEGLDCRTASKWPNDRLLRKIEALPKMAEEDDVAKLDKAGQKLLKKLLKAVEDEDTIEILGGDAGDDAGEDAKEKASKKSSKSKKEAKEAESEEEDAEEADEEDADAEEESDEEEDEKPAKKAKGKKSSKKAEADEEDADEEDETVPVKPKKSSKKAKGDKQPSNKERIYTLWLKSKKEDPLKLKKQAKAEVEDQTVKNWCRRWAKGKGLPACARK